MELEYIIGKDLVGRIYQKFEKFSRPLDIQIQFEDIKEEIPEVIDVQEEKELINIEDFM